MVECTAPSNIALIKYMGKEQDNIPANMSLSYSLGHLLTTVSLERTQATKDVWKSYQNESETLNLSEAGKTRYLDFFAKLKREFGISGNFVVRSKNNFPSDCGLASSASSFAALSIAAYRYSVENNPAELKEKGFTANEAMDLKLLSSYSRQGSGSSCRSLYPEWAIWEDDHAYSEDFPYDNLLHLAVISEGSKKEVSSSQAHKLVRTSLLMDGRTKRAESRFHSLKTSLQQQDWQQCFEICWAEFWDMHALFETSSPSFGYMNSGSLEILNYCKTYWAEKSDGPIVTMDAGPNVHLLFRKDQQTIYSDFKKYFSGKFKVWGNQ